MIHLPLSTQALQFSFEPMLQMNYLINKKEELIK